MKFSQREARRLRNRVIYLENTLARQSKLWVKDWPGGVHFWTMNMVPSDSMAAIRTARALGHAVVVVPEHDNNTLRFYALAASTEEKQ
jgi:hypothetical protein